MSGTSTQRLAATILSFALALVCSLFLGSGVALAQGSDGRTVNPPSKRQPSTRRRSRPKKVTRGRASTDRETVPTSSVIIRSYPPGADVFIDGIAVGTTGEDGELELSEVRLGAHRVVLRKEGYREWAQTVMLTSSDVAEEVEPLLQSENAQLVRDVSTLPVVKFGSEVSGQVTRDDQPLRDGSGYYDEYALNVVAPDSYLLTVRATGFEPELKIVDDTNRPYPLQRLNGDIYQSGFISAPGTYFIQIAASMDESTFIAGEYALRVLEESEARGEQPIRIGETVSGALEPTDRASGPQNFYDAWSFEGNPGVRVRIRVEGQEGLQLGLTLLRDQRLVMDDGGEKKKDKKKRSKGRSSQIETVLKDGKYTIYVSTEGDAPFGPYSLTLEPVS